jgi:hypothetical protein
MAIEEEQVERYGWTRCMVAAIHNDTYAGPWEVEDREDGAWAEVDALLALRDRRHDEAFARALGIDVERYADDDLPIGETIAELRGVASD